MNVDSRACIRHSKVRKLLLATCAGFGVWMAIGTSGAVAADGGLVGAIVTPITAGIGLNLNQTNINVLGVQNRTGNAIGNKVNQENSVRSATSVR
jgi:hypothetical protein